MVPTPAALLTALVTRQACVSHSANTTFGLDNGVGIFPAIGREEK